MLSPTQFRDLVSGRQSGGLAAMLRGALRVCETPYTWAMRWRNHRYDRGLSPTHRVDAPVVSIGNLTLGGTGKTPMVVWVARFFRRQGARVAIVSRGYGAGKDGRNDEALELEQALPDVPHIQDANRVVAAQAAIQRGKAELVVLDDGFQHRRLERDLDIVLLDASEPFGFDHVFPRGTLREQVAGLARADVVVLSRADMLDASGRETIRARVEQLAPRAVWCEVAHVPQSLVNAAGQSAPLDSLAGRRVCGFCGIGNPAGFRHTLQRLSAELAAWREFPDHHGYSRADIESLVTAAADTDMAICTRKDLVKLNLTQLGGTPLWCLRVEIEFLAGRLDLEAALAGVRQQSGGPPRALVTKIAK